MWIYKHKLFHRDRPEDLHLVRRRTCPGLDGRKQRFSRFSARQLSGGGSASDDDEESSVEAVVAIEVSVSSEISVKRDLDTSAREHPEPKRVRKVLSSEPPIEEQRDIFVDTSMLNEADAGVEDGEEVSSQSAKDERLEAAEQSLIVSEVSKKLEQFAKRAAYGGSGSRSKRGGTGVVTPPFGSAHHFSSTALLTYDDEYLAQSEEDRKDALWVITDSDSLAGEDQPLSSIIVTPEKRKVVVAVENVATAQSIVSRIMESRSSDKREELVAPSSVLGFCVATAPFGDENLCSKILQLLASCEELASDFHTYRAALRPDTISGRGSLQQIWSRESSRVEAIRDFKTFAVNVFTKFLEASDNDVISGDRVILERTAEAWVKSL